MLKGRKAQASGSPVYFVAGAILLMVIWLGAYEGYLRPLGQPDFWLTQFTGRLGSWLLNLIGYETQTEYLEDSILLSLQSQPLLIIARNCNGLTAFALFAGFILLFPKNYISKLFFIPAGIFILFLLNVLRVAALALVQLYHPEWLDFNHKYTFTILIYAAVFGLWMWWVNCNSNNPSKHAAAA